MPMLSFADALSDAHAVAMERDPTVYTIGIAVSNLNHAFGTTRGLHERFPGRVFDIPISENAVTGIALGSALVGCKPVLVHMRFEFAMLTMDQIANQAAKVSYMSAGQHRVPMTIRMAVGRGWGQSSQHGQSLHAWLAHIPGLKVVMPATARDAKGLLLAAIDDPSPVMFIEHRWLHPIVGEVPEGWYTTPIGVPTILREGEDVTIVGSSYMTLEAWHAARELDRLGVSAEVVDLRTIAPLDTSLVEASVRKTGRLIVCDQGTLTGGFAGEIVARVAERCLPNLKHAPVRIALPDAPLPTTRALANYYYPNVNHIVAAACASVGRPGPDPWHGVAADSKLDVADAAFNGPF